MTQVISEPTRVVNDCSSLIDLAFVSVPGMVHLCEAIPPLCKSNHLGIHLIMPTKLNRNLLKPQLCNIWRYNLIKLYGAIDSMEWETSLSLQIMEICIRYALVKTKKNVP